MVLQGYYNIEQAKKKGKSSKQYSDLNARESCCFCYRQKKNDWERQKKRGVQRIFEHKNKELPL